MKQIENLKLSYRRTFNTDDGEQVIRVLALRQPHFLAIHTNLHLTKDNAQPCC